MPRFLVDEDLPRSLAASLREAGLDVVDVRDIGLRGKADAEVFARAQAERRVLLTGDLGFASVISFPAASHVGIVVARLPNEMPVAEVNRTIREALAVLGGEELDGALVIVERNRTRVRRQSLR